MKLINRLLRKNTSPARIAGFILSNFIGLAIITGAIQTYQDSRSLWADSDSFMKSDFLVVNKKVTAANTWADAGSAFTPEEIADLGRQPWVRSVGCFTSSDYRVWASVSQAGRGMSTMLFFESVPDAYVDGRGPDWRFRPGDDVVPVIISRDYLALYNFGFAGSAGLPQMSEAVMSGIPLRLVLTSDDGRRQKEMAARVVGFSDKLNTILVPQTFMDWSNAELGTGAASGPSRLMIDVSSPGDVAIKDYLAGHSLEVAGDKSSSSASFLLKVVIGIILAVGVLITLLSFFILLLSMSLLMEKNRDKLHALLMLGCDTGAVGRPYVAMVVWSSLAAWIMAAAACLALRASYLKALEGLGAEPSGWWAGPLAGLAVTLLLMAVNILSVRARVRRSWRL